MRIDITALFVCLDDFAKLYEEACRAQGISAQGKRQRSGYLSLSEMLLIEVLYHVSPFKDFKRFYKYGIEQEQRDCFGKLPCYERYVATKYKLFMPLTILLHCLFGEKTGLYFADSTPLKVCHNKRISNHKVFKGLAERGKSSMGWFYGFKIHMILNEKSQIVALQITPGNVDDRKSLRCMVKNLKGKCYADKGYISQNLFEHCWQQGLHLITGIRKNMKNYLMPLIDKILIRKRFIIETTFGILKTDMNIEHSRHRSPTNAFVSILAALVAYQLKSNKPKIKTNLIPA